MTPSEMLRDIATKLDNGCKHVQLTWPRGNGRFPFAGAGTEICCVNEREGVTVYLVPIPRVLTFLAKAIKNGK